MRSVFKKEFAGFFRSMPGFVYLAVFFALTGYYFTVNNLLAQSNDIREYFSTMLLSLMFLIPILTMRLLCEERKLRTDQLLFTSPLTVLDVVLGKFFAAFAVFLIGIGMTLVFVITLAMLGGVEVASVVGCYIGAVLAGACFIALGLFVSSITDSQVVSAIVTYSVLIGLYLVSMLAGYVQSGFLVMVLDYIAVFRRYTEFTFGIFDPAAAFYYLSLSALFIFFAVLSAGRMLGDRNQDGRRQDGRRQVSRNQDGRTQKQSLVRASVALLVVLSLVAAVGANVLVGTLTERFGLRLDLTSSGLYQISEESVELMKTLNRKVSIYCVSESRDAVKEFTELLDKYERASEQIEIAYIDPYANYAYLDALAAKGYEVGLNTIVVESEEKLRVLRMADMYQFNSDGSELIYFNGESMLTSAIMSVSSDAATVTGVIMGHGEDVPAELQQLLVRNNHDLIGVVLNQNVGEEIDTLLAYAPQGDYSVSELAQLDAFFKRGGSLILFSDPAIPDLPNFDAFLEEWGIVFGNNIIFDSVSNLEANPANLIGFYTEHSITSYFKSRQFYTVVPAARSIENRFGETNGRALEAVMATSDNAYARRIPSSEQTAERLPQDEAGPFMLAVTSTMDFGGTNEGRIFAVGSKRIASDEMIQSSAAGNAKFISLALEWCAGNAQGTSVAIAPKQVGMSELAVPTSTAYTLGVIFVAVLPLMGLLCGLRVYLRRRHL